MIASDFITIAYAVIFVVSALICAYGIYDQIKLDRAARDSLFSDFDALAENWNNFDYALPAKSTTSHDMHRPVDRNASKTAANKKVDRKAQTRTRAFRRRGLSYTAKHYRYMRKS
ncbi:hypothetical protein [Loktanella sp. SALINAS62]|uniref:hypothetical protein n=1 Tax=Loktanella sp. SALINAS62 TaxID=2706124 RepID=UPI001B8B39B0|nr:hypothetical protein [Loktanella sp. SALINAS62]MBS1301378.1 hypothetical protein [Loktanella sp. SALINAS62]